MGWTEAQQKVIDTRNKNLLVSAAAGSGKTAVLVERIISMISEGDNPIDIDRLLVVTFTNAAAAEMRGRIGKAIDAKLEKEPDNSHLQRQIALLQSAQITTIHSFCLNVIRNYFHRIDLDPSFKIADESEITLMKSEVISELLERWYEEGREDFHEFVESYSYSKSDAPIEDLVLKLHSFAMSDPWPEKWITDKKLIFEIQSVSEMSESGWMKELLSYLNAVLEDLCKKNEKAIAICSEVGGPTAYLSALTSDRNLLLQLKSAASYEEYANTFLNLSFDRLSGKKEEGVEEHKKDQVKIIREEIKKGLKDIGAQFFFQPEEEMLKDLQAVGKMMKVLLELTLDFMEEFAKKKEEKSLIDFHDLEHFALKILVEEGEAGSVPSLAAVELSEQFEEILIDEYQDSNMVQETILKSISKEAFGRPNRFMVGDVKQSIYKFRLAMPEIFMEKYESYSCNSLKEDGQINLYQRIDLDKNFRSRKTVLEYVNRVFEQIMLRTVGGIEYDQAASLKYGELYEGILTCQVEQNQAGSVKCEMDNMSRVMNDTEILLVTEEEQTGQESSAALNSDGTDNEISKRYGITSDKLEEADEEDAEEAFYTKKEIEARAIARRIKELTDPAKGMLVYDKKTNAYRPAIYSDIIILLRSMAGWSEVFVNTLMQEGISAYADTGTGYFQTLEIMTVLNMLRIIDNPRQDIPLAGILYSPIVGLTTTELAFIRASARNLSLYSALINYLEEGSEEALKGKVIAFVKILNEFRAMVSYKPIHELILFVLDQTGYYYYVSALPGGDRRKANIDRLIAQAVQFEKGSYSGLFHFIKYMEKLNKYEVDFGEAATQGEQDNTVRIMSIHKSKGLEFPIVFVSGLSKQFNTQDLRSNIVLHNELGIGPEYVDTKRRTKVPTLIKRVIQKKVQMENLGEELRVLYVAMTRAKEKLILTGYIDSEKEISSKKFSFYEIMSAKSYLDWVLPASMNHTCQIRKEKERTIFCSGEGINVSIVTKSELMKAELTKQIFMDKDKQDLLSISPEVIYDQNIKDAIKSKFNYEYPYQKEAELKIKMTVSELKKSGQFQDEEQSVMLYQHSDRTKALTLEEQEETAIIPDFIRRKESTLLSTDRGTLYHKVLELIDLAKIDSREDLKQDLKRLVQNKRIKEDDLEKLNEDYIFEFACSDIAKRMKQAAISNKLYKEKQFVIGLKASELMHDVESSEIILIQGIIDVFFEEDGELVLLDYKSDYVTNENQLVKRYKVQLDYYRKALEQMLHKKVKEMIIYSLTLSKEIRIDG